MGVGFLWGRLAPADAVLAGGQFESPVCGECGKGLSSPARGDTPGFWASWDRFPEPCQLWPLSPASWALMLLVPSRPAWLGECGRELLCLCLSHRVTQNSRLGSPGSCGFPWPEAGHTMGIGSEERGAGGSQLSVDGSLTCQSCAGLWDTDLALLADGSLTD